MSLGKILLVLIFISKIRIQETHMTHEDKTLIDIPITTSNAYSTTIVSVPFPEEEFVSEMQLSRDSFQHVPTHPPL